MENTPIVNYSQLISRLTTLKSERDNEEIMLRYNFNEFISKINIFSFFKFPTTNKDFQSNDFLKTGMSMTVNLIAGLMFGKNRSIKGFLSTLMFERLAKMAIDNNLIGGFSKLFGMFFSKNRSQNIT